MDFANSYDNLHKVRWFNFDGSSNNHALSSDPPIAAFIEDVNFVSIQYATSTNDVYINVRDHFANNYPQKTLYVGAYSLYDSVFVLGKTILAIDSIDPLIVSDALIDVAATHTGTMGTIHLNEFGDREILDYDLWTIQDGEWIEYGRFNSESDTFDYYMMDK